MRNKLLILLFLLLQGNAFSEQTIQEGVATFEFSYPDAESSDVFAYKPKGIKIYFKKDKSREEYDHLSRWVNIVDPDKKEILFMNTPNAKTAMKMTMKEKEENQALEFGIYDVKVTDETKDIAGYKCKKAIVTYKGKITGDEERTMEVWFTEQLRVTNTQYFFKGINGFIMRYTHVTTPDANVTFREVLTCTKVEKTTVSDDMFRIPDDCKISNWEDVNKHVKIEYP